ncbi:hypothetical protein ABE504_15825 [Paenibacillus oryzisoli]|uniref:hypothetical protein n=1 Tax=Paenibacillus oryzisoli TaxID=1850517 RepID=UPI003D27EF54
MKAQNGLIHVKLTVNSVDKGIILENGEAGGDLTVRNARFFAKSVYFSKFNVQNAGSRRETVALILHLLALRIYWLRISLETPR